MARDRERESHREWLGYLQPVGLVVSPPALVAAQAFIDRNIAGRQQVLEELIDEASRDHQGPESEALRDFPALATRFLGWEPADLVGGPGAAPVPDDLAVPLPNEGDLLRPTYAVREWSRDGDMATWLLLIEQVGLGVDLDRAPPAGKGWLASPQARFERLLRETRVPIGLLLNGTHLRLVYAPRGESTGHLTFPFQAMREVAGRPILAALHMLLSADRLFSLAPEQRLPAILAGSRKFQAEVSTRLSGQVLSALYELLRGFQSADDQRRGLLVGDVLSTAPDEVYAGLLTVLLRLVFLLYAEDRGLMSADSVYVNHYAVTGLYERLRDDAGHHPDTMDQRYGAWAQLLTLFRLVHDGARHGAMRLPARRGELFDPDAYPFLEGRRRGSHRQVGERLVPPLVSDGVVARVLERLLVLDGERLSYRSLDVEQIGSVYEAMMGFRLERASGPSVAVKPKKTHGAPVTVDLAALLAVPAGERSKWLKERTDQALPAAGATALKSARSLDDLVAALGSKVARELTPNTVPAGAMVLQPSEERRRSGSHYTPRTLTEPIVRKALEPVLARLGANPRPEAVLALKVCDPAMGSGAFLVEACRQLGEVLVRSWHAHGMPEIPPDEDEVLHAAREVAQRCLYGVDKNPRATSLAKLSLWLATLARDHPFTFLDHALKTGDSLVGLTREEIRAFNWQPRRWLFHEVEDHIEARLKEVRGLRNDLAAAEADEVKRVYHHQAERTLADVRLIGDLVVSAFFAGGTARARNLRVEELARTVNSWLQPGSDLPSPEGEARALREGERPLMPFHWEVEFPEVFERENAGFDVVVGNPPFAGKNSIGEANREGYLDWLKATHAGSHGNADLVAHFYRRAFNLLRASGTFGLIATNTIAQGDTRSTGLRWICTHGGTIYRARRRYKWPGQAAVVVSVVHVQKGPREGPFDLDGREVPLITAFLFHAGGHNEPEPLATNAGRSFQGTTVLGMGFTFDDTDRSGVASSLAEMRQLIEKDVRNGERIFPYIGGEEVNDNPTHAHSRYVINFEDMSEEVARRWPDLMEIVEKKVKGKRASHSTAPWWQFERPRVELAQAITGLERILIIARVANAFAFTFLPSRVVANEKIVVFPFATFGPFATLQSRVHEIWTRFFSSTLKDDLQYTPSLCFETFPFPEEFESDPVLEEAGREYYEHRAAVMVARKEGLTKTYNRFHDPGERGEDIVRLRELHRTMDRAVLAAYGWDLEPKCDFLLDYEEDEEEETGGRQRRKPWRYRWPDEARDEVLARLLELNRVRAERERLAGK